uniref:Uncharacterized protein n=1 Tax=Amphimedon queenslandica TaxID=400682 RepID=A0A1X7UKQ6_AMPQE
MEVSLGVQVNEIARTKKKTRATKYNNSSLKEHKNSTEQNSTEQKKGPKITIIYTN